MGAEKEIIVALEFGTSAIRAIAGRKKADGSIQVLGIEHERVTDAIQRGVIYNIDKTTQAITNVTRRLNDSLGIHIQRAYVGVGGQSLHTAGNIVSRGLETKVKITPELVDNLMDNNRATQYTDSQILEVVPQEYMVGNRIVTDPVGIQSDQIEARFMNVVARNTLLENINKCMRMAEIEVADLFISPLALADVLLSDNEKRSGCAMVDFGAGTTTVAVYNGNLLRHLVVIPLGGNNITNDLVLTHQMDFEEAESLKRKSGVAYVAAESDNPQQIPISNDRKISENELQNIIGAREEEIIQNIWHQIERVSDKLLSGIITPGGAAQLKDMPDVDALLVINNERLREIYPELTVINAFARADDTLIALLMHGDSNCASEPEPEEEVAEPVVEHPEEPAKPEVKSAEQPEPVVEKPKGSSRWKRLTQVLGRIFEEESDD